MNGIVAGVENKEDKKMGLKGMTFLSALVYTILGAFIIYILTKSLGG